MKWNWRVCENRKTSSVLQQQETTTSCRGQSETSVQITKRLGFANTSYNIFHFSAVNDCFGCDSDEQIWISRFVYNSSIVSPRFIASFRCYFFPFVWTHFYVQFVNLFSVVCVYVWRVSSCVAHVFVFRQTMDGTRWLLRSTPNRHIEIARRMLSVVATAWLFDYIFL